MSKRETKRALVHEINKLNKKIEIKIALGQDYRKEGQSHAKLLTAIGTIA